MNDPLTINDLRVLRSVPKESCGDTGKAITPLTPAEFADIAKAAGYVKLEGIDRDFMCLTHGQTVPYQPESCDFDDQGDCRYAWVALVELPDESFMDVWWVAGVDDKEDDHDGR